MVKLFKYENFSVVIDPEAILLKPFKEIWERDKSADKSIATMEFGFIYFMCDPRSDYQYILEEEERAFEIKRAEGLPEDWEPDASLKEAMDFYESFKPISAGLVEDSKVAIGHLRKFLRNIDLYATDDKGKPIYTVNSITSAIKAIPGLLRDLEEVERALKSEIVESTKVRGNAVKSVIEDGIDI